jgi:hypothetical protein
MNARVEHQESGIPAGSFGLWLRSERERRRISLEGIAANTKIGLSLLKGLEKDDVSRWPSGIFRRSFMRSYAEAIGLDGDEMVQEFLDRFPDPHEPTVGIGAVGPAKAGQYVSSPAKAGHYVGGTARAAARHDPNAVLRLTLADARPPFWSGPILIRLRSRLAAAFWDIGILMAVAMAAFLAIEAFWAPLAIAALCYYGGAILLLGNTPGVCLVAPRLKSEESIAEQDGAELLDRLSSDPPVLLNLDRIRS